MKSVYSAVRTGPLNKAVCASSVKGFISLKHRFLSSLLGIKQKIYITLREVSLVNTTNTRNTECNKNFVIQNGHTEVAVCGTFPCYVQLSNSINEHLQVLVILNQE